jgi:hypothetical protein
VVYSFSPSAITSGVGLRMVVFNPSVHSGAFHGSCAGLEVRKERNKRDPIPNVPSSVNACLFIAFPVNDAKCGLSVGYSTSKLLFFAQVANTQRVSIVYENVIRLSVSISRSRLIKTCPRGDTNLDSSQNDNASQG